MADPTPATIRQATKLMMDFLRWVDSVESYSVWPVEWSIMQRKADDGGLVERRGRDPGMIGFTRWQLTDAGKRVLANGR